MLFTDEVKDTQELVAKLQAMNYAHNFKIAVVCFIFDKEGHLILQKRGVGARDNIGKIEAVGGALAKDDRDFRAGLLREIKEEAGSEAVVKIDYFIGAYEKGDTDKNTGAYINWLILAYRGSLERGEVKITEPLRCEEYCVRKLEDYREDELAVSTYQFVKHLKELEKVS